MAGNAHSLQTYVCTRISTHVGDSNVLQPIEGGRGVTSIYQRGMIDDISVV